MMSLKCAHVRALQSGRPLHMVRQAKRFRCWSTANGPDGEESADENKAFKIKQGNRRQPVQKSDGASSDLISAMSELSKGRAQPSQGTKSVFGADQMSWRAMAAWYIKRTAFLANKCQTTARPHVPQHGGSGVDGDNDVQEVDEAVNEYPCERVFTAIGDATPGFQQNMIACVEKALNCKIHPESIQIRQSSGSKYVSIKVGPVIVSNADEVVAVFTSMKADERLKWFI